MTKEEAEAAEKYRQHMLEHTLRLVEVGSLSVEPPEKIQSASGILVELRGRYFVLSAGHVLSKGKWVIETNKHFYPPKVVVLGLPDAHVFHSDREDFAWVEIDFRSLFAKMKADPKFDPSWVELPVYKGPLGQEPDPSMPFGFASWKATNFIAGINTVEREARYEIQMKYDGIDKRNGLYRFLLAREHQGHDYYHGCSGAPISDAKLRIVSLVVKGPEDDEKERRIIYGSPLAKYIDVIGKA